MVVTAPSNPPSGLASVESPTTFAPRVSAVSNVRRVLVASLGTETVGISGVTAPLNARLSTK